MKEFGYESVHYDDYGFRNEVDTTEKELSDNFETTQEEDSKNNED